MVYLEKHRKIFLKSFKLDALAFKLLVTDILFILTILLVYGILYTFWMKNILSVSAILEIEDGVMPVASNLDIPGIWKAFVTKIIFMLILGFLLYLLLISLYSAFSHTFMTNKRFTLKLFLNFLMIYTLLTLLYLMLITLLFFISKNVMFIAWSIIILTLIYLYSLLIFYLVINDGKFMKIMRHGLKSVVRLHDTLLPLLLGLVLITLASIILGTLLEKVIVLAAVLAFLVFLYLLTWLRKYLRHIIHETKL